MKKSKKEEKEKEGRRKETRKPLNNIILMSSNKNTGLSGFREGMISQVFKITLRQHFF